MEKSLLGILNTLKNIFKLDSNLKDKACYIKTFQKLENTLSKSTSLVDLYEEKMPISNKLEILKIAINYSDIQDLSELSDASIIKFSIIFSEITILNLNKINLLKLKLYY